MPLLGCLAVTQGQVEASGTAVDGGQERREGCTPSGLWEQKQDIRSHQGYESGMINSTVGCTPQPLVLPTGVHQCYHCTSLLLTPPTLLHHLSG
jgi:hypothetical protein